MEAVKFEPCHERGTQIRIRGTAEELQNKPDPAQKS